MRPFTLGEISILAYPTVYVYILELIPSIQVMCKGRDMFNSSEKAVLCLILAVYLVHREREVVVNFGQSYQRYKVGTLN